MAGIRWWPHTEDPRVASFRLRCQRIIDALRVNGVDAGLYRPAPASTEIPTVLVLGKRYDDTTLNAAMDLRRTANTRIVLDLCDNHFHVDNAEPRLLDRARQLRQAVAAADQVIVASASLGEIVSEECGSATPIVVIPDASESPFEPGAFSHLMEPRAEWAYLRLVAALRASGVPRGRRLLWFGNHGSPGAEGGMADLARIRERVEHAHQNRPLTLTVVSNDANKFERLISQWAVPTHYLAWKAQTFSRVARLHGLAVVPITPNPFTRCKTNNRIATAFEHGLNVAADSIPSYVEFADQAILDDWQLAIGSYLDDIKRRVADIEGAQRLLAERYSIEAMCARWREALIGSVRVGGIA